MNLLGRFSDDDNQPRALERAGLSSLRHGFVASRGQSMSRFVHERRERPIDVTLGWLFEHRMSRTLDITCAGAHNLPVKLSAENRELGCSAAPLAVNATHAPRCT